MLKLEQEEYQREGIEWVQVSGVGTVERLGGPLRIRSKMLAPEAILHKIQHVTVKLIMRLLIVGGGQAPLALKLWPHPPLFLLHCWYYQLQYKNYVINKFSANVL